MADSERKTYYSRLLQKNDTEANWSTNNPVLKTGELGIVNNTNPPRLKIGQDKNWNDTPYVGVSPTITTSKVDDTTTLTITDVNGTKTVEILDGITPFVQATFGNPEEEGATVEYQFQTGDSIFVKNGSKGSTGATGAKGDKGDKGETGAKGADGKTPIKGTDYFTAADINTIVEAVYAKIADGNEVSY